MASGSQICNPNWGFSPLSVLPFIVLPFPLSFASVRCPSFSSFLSFSPVFFCFFFLLFLSSLSFYFLSFSASLFLLIRSAPLSLDLLRPELSVCFCPSRAFSPFPLGCSPSSPPFFVLVPSPFLFLSFASRAGLVLPCVLVFSFGSLPRVPLLSSLLSRRSRFFVLSSVSSSVLPPWPASAPFCLFSVLLPWGLHFSRRFLPCVLIVAGVSFFCGSCSFPHSRSMGLLQFLLFFGPGVPWSFSSFFVRHGAGVVGRPACLFPIISLISFIMKIYLLC